MILAYPTIVGYAIVRHHLLDINIVIKKSLVYTALVTFLTIVFFAFIYSTERFFQGVVGYRSILISLTTASVITLVFTPLKNFIQSFIDRHFFKGTPIEIAEQNERLLQEIIKTDRLRAIAALAGGMAHEIKNPLTAIRTFSEYLPANIDDKTFLERFSRIVNQEVQRIDQLVHQLLDFAKPALRLERVNIHQLINETLNFLNSQFVVQNIDVYLEYKAHTRLELWLDPNPIRQAILNILLNAIEAMPKGGKLTVGSLITTTQERNHLQINISDTGCGIDKKNLPRIFEPFYTRKDHGTGLGLAITYGIIQEHKGNIYVESTVDAGTKFIVELPMDEKII